MKKIVLNLCLGIVLAGCASPAVHREVASKKSCSVENYSSQIKSAIVASVMGLMAIERQEVLASDIQIKTSTVEVCNHYDDYKMRNCMGTAKYSGYEVKFKTKLGSLLELRNMEREVGGGDYSTTLAFKSTTKPVYDDEGNEVSQSCLISLRESYSTTLGEGTRSDDSSNGTDLTIMNTKTNVKLEKYLKHFKTVAIPGSDQTPLQKLTLVVAPK